MHDPIVEFGSAVRAKRAGLDLTQRELAEKMNTSMRTVSKVENAQNNPRFDTVVQFARELNIGIDAIILGISSDENAVPYCVRDFFSGMSEEQARKYIELCRQADLLHE